MYLKVKIKYNWLYQNLEKVCNNSVYEEDVIMQSVQVFINTVDKVKSFVNDITAFEYDFELVSGKFVVDAKSIMGIFSLDLSKPLRLYINTKDNTDAVMDVLSAYIV